MCENRIGLTIKRNNTKWGIVQRITRNLLYKLYFLTIHFSIFTYNLNL